MFMFMFMYYPYTSLVTTGQIHVQFTLKVVIIANLVYAYIILVLGALKSKLEQPVQVLEQVVQGMSVFLLTTNMRLFLNPIINDIFSRILICEKPLCLCLCLCITFTTSLVSTGQVNVQFTLKVVIIVQTYSMHTL